MGMAESQKELCTMRGITPHQFVETYGLQESFMLENQFSMFGLNREGKDKTQEQPKATRLEEWILLAHKMKGIVNQKDDEIQKQKTALKKTEQKWQKDLEI